MKKLLFLLSLFFFISLTFSQDISGPKPILSMGGSHINPDNTLLKLGCNTESVTVDASYIENLGSPDHYRVDDETDYYSKGYLPTSGTTVLPPSTFGVPGEIIPIDLDDKWTGVKNMGSFNFCYFGDPKSDFVLSSNGILSFDTSYANNFSAWDLDNMLKIQPDANCGDNRDAILQFNDTNPADGDADWNSYYFWASQGVPNEHFLVLGIHRMPMFQCGATYGYATHQMVFYETTNVINFNIKNKPICDTWVNGYQAFGLQNANQTVGYAVPGLDNLTQVQIIDPTDSYSVNHANNSYPIEDSKTVRFIPDGVNGITPVFGWYLNWDSVTNTGTLVTSSTSLTVDKDSLPVDGSGNPIPVEYTAVVHYVEYCSNLDIYSTNTITFELNNPIQMHLQEQDSPDDTTEFIVEEEINLCPNEDYTLTAIVQDADPTRSFKLEWTVEYFDPVTSTTVTTSLRIDDPVTSDANGDVNIDYFIDHTLADTLTPGINYTFTCTLTDGAGTSDFCLFSDTVIIKVLENSSFSYSPTSFCASDTNPIPQNPNPPLATPPDPYDPDYYFTIDNGGVWVNPESDPAVSLDGVPNLSDCFANAITFNADGSASFVITYHGGCPDNTSTQTITITDSPIVLNPNTGDPTATPVIDPSPLITQCETNSVSQTAEFDLPAINNYIANGSTGLNFDWVKLPSNDSIVDTNVSYTTQTQQVQVTISKPGAPSSCDVVMTFYLRVVQKPVIVTPTLNLKQCENGDPDGTAPFFGTLLENKILSTLINPADYTIHYSAVDVDGNPVTQIYVGGVAQAFESPLPATFNVESVTVTAYVTLNTDVLEGCPSDDITFNLVVKEIPIVTVPSETSTPPAILKLCETDIVNHAADFDTTNWNTIVLSGNPTPINPDYLIEYDYVDMGGIPVTGVNTMPNPFTSKSQTIIVRVINTPSGTDACSSQDFTFDLEVIENPTIIKLQDTVTTPLILCEDDTNADSTIHTALFDTSAWNDFILNRPTMQNDAAYTVNYTYVDVDGNSVTTNTLPTSLELSSQTISTVVQYEIDATTFCESETKTFDVTVINSPIVAAVPTMDIILCETDSVNHTAEFDTSSWENTILGGSQPAADYYITYSAVEVLADGTTTPFPLPVPFPEVGNTSTFPDLIISATVNYNITAAVNSTCSSTSVDFQLEVIETPVATPLVDSTDTPIILCETDTTNHRAEFDTTNWNSIILGPDQTTGYDVEYTAFTVDPITLIEIPFPLPVPFPEATNISTLPSLKIYIRAFYDIDASTRCESNETSFFIEANPSPSIAVPSDIGFPVGNETLELCQSDINMDGIPDTNTDGVPVATFDTFNWISTILAGQSGNNYHVILTAVDLNGDTVTLPNPLPVNFETESLIIYATVTDDSIPCDSPTKEFNLVVKEIPTNNDITDITQCEDDNNANPNYHTSIFDTSSWTSTVIGTQTPDDLVVEYTYNLPDGTPTTVIDGASVSSTLPPTIESKTQTVSVIIKNTTNTITCFDPTPKTFELIVIEEPTIVELTTSVTPDISLTICQTDINTDGIPDTDVNGNPVATFDTTNWNDFILDRPTIQNDADYFVEYTYVDANGNTVVTNDSTVILPTNLELGSQTISSIVKYKIDDTTFCESEVKMFDVEVRLIPFIADLIDNTEDIPLPTEIVDLKICEDDVAVDPTVHTAQFDTTYWNAVILANNPQPVNLDYVIEYTYVDINGNTQTVESTSLQNPFVLTSQTIEYTVENRTLGEDTCKSEVKTFDVVVDLLPEGTNGLAVVCSGSTDYITIDDATATPPTYKAFTFDDFAQPHTDNGNNDKNTYRWRAIIDNPDVTGESLSIVDSGDVDNPTITDTLINNTQIVQFITYEVIPFSEFECEGLPFEIIVQVDVAPNMTDQTTVICNEEQVNFDFDNYTSLTGNSYTWYAIENNNVEGESTSEMTTSVIEDAIINISGVAQIVEYIVTPKSVGGCEGNTFSVFVTVNPRPDFDLKPQYFICPDVGYVMIGEDTNSDDYIYYWFEANDINTEIDLTHPKQLKVTEEMLATSNGNYVLTVEDKYTHCVYSQFTTVSMAEQMVIASIHVSDFNTPDNTITVAMVDGTGAYEYTLHYTDNNGVPQTITQNSPIFEHLNANTYQIEVTDLNNCSVTIFSNDVYVLDYPPFFTPNGDGVNETWTITGANIIPNSKIYIFDRYGKVLAQVDPTSVLGWDGTYKGILVPEDDYWFTAEYVDPNTGEAKVVKGHFSIVIE